MATDILLPVRVATGPATAGRAADLAALMPLAVAPTFVAYRLARRGRSVRAAAALRRALAAGLAVLAAALPRLLAVADGPPAPPSRPGAGPVAADFGRLATGTA